MFVPVAIGPLKVFHPGPVIVNTFKAPPVSNTVPAPINPPNESLTLAISSVVPDGSVNEPTTVLAALVTSDVPLPERTTGPVQSAFVTKPVVSLLPP